MRRARAAHTRRGHGGCIRRRGQGSSGIDGWQGMHIVRWGRIRRAAGRARGATRAAAALHARRDTPTDAAAVRAGALLVAVARV